MSLIRKDLADCLTISPIGKRNVFGVNLMFEYDNLFNLHTQKELVEAAKFIFIHDVNCNRLFERTVNECLKYIPIGCLVEFCLSDNECLTYFGLKSVVRKFTSCDFELINQSSMAGRWYVCYKRLANTKCFYSSAHTGWTFGVLHHDPSRKMQALESIRRITENIKGPYEILMIGDLSRDYIPPEVVTLPPPDKSTLMHTTKIKNLICQSAKYSDICIMDDLFGIDIGFQQDFNSYGYGYGVCCPRIYTESDSRCLDWGGRDDCPASNTMLLDYRTYSNSVHLSGGISCIRKDFWSRHKWNENLYINEDEDVEFSRRIQRDGNIIYLTSAKAERLTDGINQVH